MSNPVPDIDDYIAGPGTSGNTPRTCTVRIIPPAPLMKNQSRKRSLLPPPQEQDIPPFNPDIYGEVIPEGAPRPVCEICSLAFLTWAAFEYHTLRYHIDYRPYRCVGCKTLSFHTEAEGRYHLALYHSQGHSTFSLLKRTDYDLENERIACLMSAKTTEQIDVSLNKERLKRGIDMMQSIQMTKFRGAKAQLPISIRHEIDPVDASTEQEPEVAEEATVEYAEPESEEYFGQDVEYNYEDTDELGTI